ncbi:TldD/PmbA family protein [Baekduia sp. Peel2402]|uniref:TldD/PmbA family protein n=1 Tax=Baekduia sp. Peel2402 TaxID=3458296 RepID=UPI00403E634D
MSGGLDLAAHALSFLRGADDAQATIEHERSLLLRFARSAPTQATAIDDATVHLLALRDGHAGAATTNRTDDDALRDAARRAIAAAEAAARAAGGPGDHPGLPGPAEEATARGESAAGGHADPDAWAARGGAALRGAFDVARDHDLEAFGAWTAGTVETAIANARGTATAGSVSDAYMKVMHRDARARTGRVAQAATQPNDLDPEAIARAAAAKITPQEPVTLPPGEYPVVLDHDAVGGLLDMLAGLAFNGRAHVEGRGALSDRLGETVAARGVTLSDDPRHPRQWARAFDLEGLAKRPITLLDDGVAKAVVHDTRSATFAGDGARSTGHAIAPGGDPYGPVPTNLVLHPGDAESLDALVAPIARGIYVTRFWYLNVVHPRQTLITGTTRDGTFLIEDGRITKPLKDVRITDSILELLERTEALTEQLQLVSEAEYYGRRFALGAVVPALRCTSLRITG